MRRITAGSSWIPEIDGLRFLAILLVVFFHLSAEVMYRGSSPLHARAWYGGVIDFFRRGDIGVRIFFVISGFILARPFARHYLLGHPRPSLRSYYQRRLTRLEPPYLLNLAVLASVSIFLGSLLQGHAQVGTVLTHFAAGAVYLQGLIFGGQGVINPVAWTLEMEAQFYLLMPLLALIFRVRSRWLRRLALAALSIAIPAMLELFVIGKLSTASHFWATICVWLQYFLAGILLSDLYVTEMASWRASRIWDIVSGIAWCILLFTGHAWAYPLEPLLIALAFVGAFRGRFLHRLFSIEWIAIVGGMCYSIYLWHFFVIAVVFRASRRLLVTHDVLVNIAAQSVLMLPAILVVCGLYFLLIERPCMDPAWPQKLRAAVSNRLRRPQKT